MASFPVNTWL